MKPIARCPDCSERLIRLSTEFGIVILDFVCGTSVYVRGNVPYFTRKCTDGNLAGQENKEPSNGKSNDYENQETFDYY